MRRLAHIIGSTFGSGFSPVAPGTVGSFVAIVVLWLLPPLHISTLIFVLFVFFGIGVWAASLCELDWGHDPGRVVWDEVVGMMVTVIALPKHWITFTAAFVLFRIFDIVKPFPVNKSQELPGGWGVMVDDVIAGIYANVILHIVFRLLFPSFAGLF